MTPEFSIHAASNPQIPNHLPAADNIHARSREAFSQIFMNSHAQNAQASTRVHALSPPRGESHSMPCLKTHHDIVN